MWWTKMEMFTLRNSWRAWASCRRRILMKMSMTTSMSLRRRSSMNTICRLRRCRRSIDMRYQCYWTIVSNWTRHVMTAKITRESHRLSGKRQAVFNMMSMVTSSILMSTFSMYLTSLNFISDLSQAHSIQWVSVQTCGHAVETFVCNNPTPSNCYSTIKTETLPKW